MIPSSPEFPLFVAVIRYEVPDPLKVPKVQLFPVLVSDAEVNPVTEELNVMLKFVAEVLVVVPLFVIVLLLIVTVGPVVTITTPVKGEGDPDVTVPLVCFTAIEYVESGRVENVQVSVVATTVLTQVTAVPEVGVAVKVTVAPTTNELDEKVGVLSFVFLSVFEDPVSEAASNTGVVGVATVIALVAIEIFVKLGASFPKAS